MQVFDVELQAEHSSDAACVSGCGNNPPAELPAAFGAFAAQQVASSGAAVEHFTISGNAYSLG